MTVAVMTAYWQCGPWLRRAVDSILGQTYRDLRLYVVNDADPVSPWPLLADIDDPRLIRFDLPTNRGRFFADAVVLAADREATHWALMDPDDYSDPDRLAELVPLAEQFGAALAPHRLYRGSFDAQPAIDDRRLRQGPDGSRLRHHAGYASAVLSTDRIRAAGGFHAGVRVAFDTYLTMAVKLLGPWAVHDRPFTHKVRRADSLMTAVATGLHSPLRVATRARLDALWRVAWRRARAGDEIASVVARDVPGTLAGEVERLAVQLRGRIPVAVG